MNDAIKKYMQRRDARMKQRCDDEGGDPDWITVNHSHVPLEGGKSVGGWSKGRDFSSAKSTKRFKSYGESNVKHAMEKKARHYNNSGSKQGTNNHAAKQRNSNSDPHAEIRKEIEGKLPEKMPAWFSLPTPRHEIELYKAMGKKYDYPDDLKKAMSEKYPNGKPKIEVNESDGYLRCRIGSTMTRTKIPADYKDSEKAEMMEGIKKYALINSWKRNKV